MRLSALEVAGPAARAVQASMPAALVAWVAKPASPVLQALRAAALVARGGQSAAVLQVSPAAKGPRPTALRASPWASPQIARPAAGEAALSAAAIWGSA